MIQGLPTTGGSKKILANIGIIRSFQWVATGMRQPTARAG